MSFNIFGAATKDNVRVGYVDPERGYITNQSIYEANVHASKNPGTIFILETRDRIRYLTINEVNNLGPEDITPDEVACQDGIKGLRPGETPTFPGGNQPIIVSGGNGSGGGSGDTAVKVGSTGGTPLTTGGTGGRPVLAGTVPLTAGGNPVKSGGTGGTPIFLGGTGGIPVLLGNQPLTINGKGLFVGGEGGLPLTSGGTGGTKLATDGTNECEGKIYISGGGGVGAYAVPVFGTDGSLLSAIVTDGGYGYKTPPQARIVDTCKRGSGAVLRSLLGEISSRTEYYDKEEDFEIYDLTPPGGGVTAEYGNRFDPDGKIVGKWDPTLFASLQDNPIARQIQEYQDFLKELKNPWWHTRKETPLEVIFRGNSSQVKHDVQHWAWGGKTVITTEPGKSGSGKSQPPTKNDQLEELEFEVYSQGGNQADRDLQFTFTSEDGSHKFQFKAPEFKDDRKTKVKRKVKRNTVYKVVASGRYKGKGVEQGLVAGIGRKAKEIKGNKKGTVIFADFVRSSNDNDDLQVRATQGKFTATGERKTTDGHSTNDLTFKFESSKDFKPEVKKENPQKKVTRVIEDSFMNRYAISPTAPSNVPSSDYAGRVATFVWEEDFPISGNYKFRGMADNIGKIFIDNELVLEERRFKGDPTKVVSRYIEEGVHEIKVELFNIPIKEKPKPKPGRTGCPTEIDFKITTEAKFANGIKIPGLNIDVSKAYDGKQLNESFRRKVELGKEYDVITESARKGSTNRGYRLEFDGLNKANNPIQVSGARKSLRLLDGDGDDRNARFHIESSSPGVDARFSNDGKNLEVKGNGDVTIRLSWDDNPGTAGVAVRSIKLGGKTWRQRGTKGEQTETIKVRGSNSGSRPNIRLRTAGANVLQMEESTDSDWQDLVCTVSCGRFIKINGNKCKLIFDAPIPEVSNNSNNSTTTQKYESIFNTADYVNKADRKLWRTNVYGRSGFLSENGICPFDTKRPLDGNPYAGTHVIRWEHIDFPADGNYDIDVEVDDSVKLFIGNRTGEGSMGIGNGLRDINKGGDEVIIEKNGFVGDSNKGTGKTTYTRFFKKGKYRIRAELKQKPGGVFSFDKDGRAGGPDVTARFIERGGQNYLKVEGSGSAEIHFRLRTDDNPGNSGSFASKIKIGKGNKDSVELRRSQNGRSLKEKETINGSAFFEAGREYPVQTFNSSRTTGSRIKNKGQTIEYDDNIDNGFDENADLTITKITNQQKSKVKGINPMALAIDIKSKSVEEPRISGRTWYQNPMGAAFTIEAPLPPIPQEPRPRVEGRCPESPTWTTRFPGGSESWWPVTHQRPDGTKTWSKFMNRFASSPLPPLSTPNSDGGGGITYSNTWQVDFPYTGFYGFKGAADNFGRILVDGQEVYKLKGFGNPSPEIVKQKVTEGTHEVTVEVVNRDQRKRKKITKEFFNTQKWQKKLESTSEKVDVNFRVTTAAKFANSVNFVGEFSFGKTYDGPQLNESVTKTLETGKVYDVVFDSNGKGGGGTKSNGTKTYPIRTEGESRTAGRRLKNSKTIEFDDDIGNGFDVNATLKIESTSPGVTARFSDDASELIVKGSGDVSLRFSWDDNPKAKGLSVGTLKVGRGDKVSWTTRQRGEKGSDRKTIKVTQDPAPSPAKPNIRLRTAGETVVQMEEHTDNDWRDLVISASEGRFYDIKGNRCKYVIGQKKEGLTSGAKIDGVTYTGPELFNFKHPAWSDFMNKSSVSPYTPPLNEDNPSIVGTFTLKWSGVKFSENGRYDLDFQADNIAKLFINGTEVNEVRSFRGEPKPRFVELSRGTYDVEIQLTNIPTNRDIFNNNPSGVALRITKDLTIVSSESKSWLNNPVGASAVILPPPCPKEIAGVGIVTAVLVEEPGNSYPSNRGVDSTEGGIPVTLKLVSIVPTATGIGYTPGDRIIVDPPTGEPFELEPELDPFGRIIGVPIGDTPAIPPPSGGDGDPGNGDPDRGPNGFDIIGNSETQILQVTDLPGQIGVPDDTGVLIPLIPSGGTASGQTVVPAPGPFYGFTEFPNIYPTSNTGLGFRGRPVFEVVVVPEKILSDDSVLQVVDIPGLRLTGYVNGKPYYGQVFAKDGNLYAGISETIGELVPVYATLQESILNRQTTRASAILRTGTEVSRNDPTLNIPNTPDNLI